MFCGVRLLWFGIPNRAMTEVVANLYRCPIRSGMTMEVPRTDCLLVFSGLPRDWAPARGATTSDDDKDLRQKKVPATIRGRERRYGSFASLNFTTIHMQK